MKNLKLFLALVLTSAFVLPFASTASADDGTAALAYVPKDTMVVVAIDIDALKKTSLVGDLMKMVQSDKEAADNLKKLKDATGFDPEKDLSSIVIAAPADVEKSQNFLIVAKGKIDEKKMVEYAKSQGSAINETKHEGVTYYAMDTEGGVAFMKDHVVIGSIDMLKAAIEVSAGKKDAVKKNSDMAAMLKSVDTSKSGWMMIALPESLRKQMGKENPLAGGILSVYASLGLASGFDLSLVANCDKDDTAKQLVDLATQGLGALAADKSMEQLGVDVVLRKLEIKASGKDIKVALKLTEDEFKKIKKTIEAFAN